MKKITWLDRLRYALDNTISRDPARLLFCFAAIAVIVIAGVSLTTVLAEN